MEIFMGNRTTEDGRQRTDDRGRTRGEMAAGQAARFSVVCRPSSVLLYLCRRRQDPPAQPGKPRVIAIQRNPFAAPFDRERGIPSVGHGRAFGIGLDTQAFENFPMPLARLHDLTVRLAEQVFAEPECGFERTW